MTGTTGFYLLIMVWNALGARAFCIDSVFNNCNSSFPRAGYIGIGIGIVVFIGLLGVLSNYLRRRRAYKVNMTLVNMQNQPGYNPGPYASYPRQDIQNYPPPSQPGGMNYYPPPPGPPHPPPPPTPPPGHMSYYPPPPGPPSNANLENTYDPTNAPKSPLPIYQKN